MAQPCESLSRHVEWHRVLASLGSPAPILNVLPQTVLCPLCESLELVVSSDHVLGGEWTSCGLCKFAGDFIELAAQKWQMAIPEALAQLSCTGMLKISLSDKLVESYIRDHVDLRRRIREFWEAAHKAPATRPSIAIRNLLRSAGLYNNGVSYAWPTERGIYLGAASRREVEDLFAPLAYSEQPRKNTNGTATIRRGSGSGPLRPFRGEGWEEVLVVPYYDLPGRICAFHFIGRNANYSAGDYIYRRANLGPTRVPVREAGVAMLPSVSRPHRLFGNDVLVISDPVVGINLQARAMREETRGLPIILSHFTPEIQTLRLPHPLQDRRLIFWGDHPTVVLQAKRSGGLISTFRFTTAEKGRRLNHRLPLEWLAILRRRAIPWYVALQRELVKLDKSAISARLESLEFTPTELDEFCRECTPDLAQRIYAADPHRFGGRSIVVDGKTIRETADGWRLHHSGELLCNVPIRLTELLTTSSGTQHYRGAATFGEETATFTLEKKSVEKRGLFPCVRDTLAADDSRNFTFNPRWSKRSEFMALQLSPPKIVPKAERIGWSQERCAFLFPKFAIRLAGRSYRKACLWSSIARHPPRIWNLLRLLFPSCYSKHSPPIPTKSPSYGLSLPQSVITCWRTSLSRTAGEYC